MIEDKEKLIVRRATEADLDSVAKLNRELTEYHVKFDEHYKFKKNIEEISRQYHSSNITSENKMLLVAEVDGEIVGFMLGKIEKTPPIYQTEEFGQLLGTFVKEEYRRKQIGEKLTLKLLEWFKSKGIKRVELSVDVRNKIGVSAWTKYGFEPFHYQMKKNL
jgi:ribosomal protein S18 acetylase RimI-like enzyme